MTSPPLDYTKRIEDMAEFLERPSVTTILDSKVTIEHAADLRALLADNARMREVLEEREAARSQPGSDAQERSHDQQRSDGWRDIASAPRDGTHILAGHAHAVFTAWWSGSAEGWVDGVTDNDDEWVTYDPSHWMPLPPPPSDHVGGEG